MQSEHTEHMGEELMTDYQFKCYKEERDEKDAMLRQEIAALKEKCAALEIEIASLRASQGGNAENGMTDYQFKAFMALLRETMKNAFELGKSQEEILAIIGDLIKGMEVGST